MSVYVGFAFSDSMVADGDSVTFSNVSMLEIVELMGRDYISCCNPSHVATLNAIKERFGVALDVPATPPKVSLSKGDAIVILRPSGLPRLTDRHEYSQAEIDAASFVFRLAVVS